MIITETCGICRGDIAIQDAGSAEQVMITLDFFRQAHTHMPVDETKTPVEAPKEDKEPFGFSKSGGSDEGEPCECGRTHPKPGRLTEEAIERLKKR